MDIQVYGEIDFLKLMSEKEDKRKKAEEIRQQAFEEFSQIETKHQDVLEQYRPASEHMQEMVDAFNAEWDPKMRNYHRDIQAAKKKYNKIIKNL